jgi:hypothetical protein
MRPGGRVIVIEMHFGEIGEPGLPPLMDLNMMVMLTGRERTLTEYYALLKARAFGPPRALPSDLRWWLWRPSRPDKINPSLQPVID